MKVIFKILLSAVLTLAANANDAAPERLGASHHRELRTNCSHGTYSTSKTYKICMEKNTSKCMKMSSSDNVMLGNYDSSNDKYLWTIEEVTISGIGDRVRLKNKQFNHNMQAKFIAGSHGTTVMKLSEASSPCDDSHPLKISFLETNGGSSNDYIRKKGGYGLRWTSETGRAVKWRMYEVN